MFFRSRSGCVLRFFSVRFYYLFSLFLPQLCSPFFLFQRPLRRPSPSINPDLSLMRRSSCSPCCIFYDWIFLLGNGETSRSGVCGYEAEPEGGDAGKTKNKPDLREGSLPLEPSLLLKSRVSAAGDPLDVTIQNLNKLISENSRF